MAGSEADLAPDAVTRGIATLRNRREAGHWNGFPTHAGLSNVWVTAFVTAHLAEVPKAKTWLAETRRWLAAQQIPLGGWSYGDKVPPDADSTAWCLIALRGSPALPAAARRAAEAFLADHWLEDGVATYLEDVDGIRKYIQAGPELSIAGWTSSHSDVTAAALLAGTPPERDLAPQAFAQLVDVQTGAGVWESYWWRGPLYTTALLLRALDRARLSLPEENAQRLLRALEREQRQDGSFSLGASTEADVFSTALALDCFRRLAHCGGEMGANRSRAALLALQQDDGAWPGGHILRIPAPNVTDPKQVSGWNRDSGGGNSFVMDEGGLFATAMAVYALGRPEVHQQATNELPLPHVPAQDIGIIAVPRI